MTLQSFRGVIDVYLMGTVHCCHAVWPIMPDQGHGRIVLTSSGAGLGGTFGRASDAAAKAAMVGLMNTLHLEGARDDIRIKTRAPSDATAMTKKNSAPPKARTLLNPETTTPGAVLLLVRDAPNRIIPSAGAGGFTLTRIRDTRAMHFTGDITPEAVAAHRDAITDPQTPRRPRTFSPNPANTRSAPPGPRGDPLTGRV